MRTRIASDPGDPILNTAVLVWDATTVPLSPGWWNAPHYYPTEGVTTLTENLLGMYPLASPVYWLSRNPLLAYNLTLFFTWPLSAFAAWLLMRRLSSSEDAAIIAGLAFGFSPIRAPAFGHLQTVATFGVPFALAGLHGYLEDGRRRWLVLLGLSWLQLGLANGYYILYGGLVIGLWVLYFCSPQSAWKRVPGLAAAGAIGTIPLVPVLIIYRQVHNALGLHRGMFEILYFSARPSSWFETWVDVRFWSRIFPPGPDNMFPGITVIALGVLGIAVALLRTYRGATLHPWLRRVLAGMVLLSGTAIVVCLRTGPIDTAIGGLTVRMRNLNRAIEILLLSGGALVALTPRARQALASRSALVFYASMVVISGLLACGPVLHAGSGIVLDPAPYGWLMHLPGFNELRAPAQLKMIHLMFIAVTAAFGYAALRPARSWLRAAFFAAAALGILADGWTVSEPMETPTPIWAAAEPANRTEPILELPLRPENDYGATLRAAIHHRRVMNGVSGYDPPHYISLREGLEVRDPDTLRAVATLGPMDVVVNGEADADGAIARYVAAAPGAVETGGDGARRVFRLPVAPDPFAVGEPIPIKDVRVIRHPETARLMIDGDATTGWGDSPQTRGQWVVADLGSVRTVGAVSTTIGDVILHYPRRLAIELSTDAVSWTRVWEGPAFAQTFLGYVKNPRNAVLAFPFAARDARYVRLQQLEEIQRIWYIAELKVHSPLGPASPASGQ
jgi:hypothetical protein